MDTITDTSGIQVDRRGFNPITFFRRNRWSIDANSTDIRSVALSVINPNEIQLLVAATSDGTPINGVERYNYIKKRENYLRLDVGIFYMLWMNQRLIPDFWKQKIDNEPSVICFDGTVFKDNRGDRYLLSLYWENDRWKYVLNVIELRKFGVRLSAVLPVKPFPQCL